jgi:hypothetical protein
MALGASEGRGRQTGTGVAAPTVSNPVDVVLKWQWPKIWLWAAFIAVCTSIVFLQTWTRTAIQAARGRPLDDWLGVGVVITLTSFVLIAALGFNWILMFRYRRYASGRPELTIPEILARDPICEMLGFLARDAVQVAASLSLMGRKRLLIRLAKTPWPTGVTPIDVSFEPIPLQEADASFERMEQRLDKKQGAAARDRAARSKIQRHHPGFSPWYALPGAVAVKTRGGIRVFVRDDSVLLAKRGARGRVDVGVAKPGESRSTSLTPAEANVLFCAWLSPLEPPRILEPQHLPEPTLPASVQPDLSRVRMNKLLDQVHADPYRPIRLHLTDGSILSVPEPWMIVVGDVTVLVVTSAGRDEKGRPYAKKWKKVFWGQIKRVSETQADPLPATVA